jgi:hypothetical protein
VQLKLYCTERDNTSKIADIKRSSYETIGTIDTSVWKNYIQHVENMQNENSVKEIVQNKVMESIIVSLIGSDSDYSSNNNLY